MTSTYLTWPYLRRKLKIIKEVYQEELDSIESNMHIYIIVVQAPIQILLVFGIIWLNQYFPDRNIIFTIVYLLITLLSFVAQIFSTGYLSRKWNIFLERHGEKVDPEYEQKEWYLNQSMNQYVCLESFIDSIINEEFTYAWWQVPFHLELTQNDMELFNERKDTLTKDHIRKGSIRKDMIFTFYSFILIPFIFYILYMERFDLMFYSLLGVLPIIPWMIKSSKMNITLEYRKTLYAWEPFIGIIDRKGREIDAIKHEYFNRIKRFLLFLNN